jgi:FAD/FMN-containing dehydrogenase
VSSLRTLVAAVVGEAGILDGPARGPDSGEDLCGHDLGLPLLWVRPADTSQVARVVGLARREGVPVVAVGKRTAYWRPLDLRGAVALEVSGLGQIIPPAAGERHIRCGAGALLRDVDETLRHSGAMLPAHPDAYGTTPVGALVATGFTSGIGMARADIETMLAGLTVVLGTGEVARMGAGEVVAGEPFMRSGLPDPSGLFVASEGALGIVTELTLEGVPLRPLGRVSWRAPADLPTQHRALALATELRVPGAYETYRVSGRPALGVADLDLFVCSPWEEELPARIGRLVDLVRHHFPGTHPVGQLCTGPRWWPGDLWQDMRANGRLVAVDLNLSYQRAAEGLAIAEEFLRAVAALAPLDARRALYFSPRFVNLGVHLLVSPNAVGAARALAGQARDGFAKLGVVPYRWGRDWTQSLGTRLEPGYRSLMARMKEVCDPDGILNPGVSFFGSASKPSAERG